MAGAARGRGAGQEGRGTGLLAEAQARKFPLMVWTVDGPQRMRAYLADGRVAGIITDLPGLAVETSAGHRKGRSHAGTASGQEDSMPAPRNRTSRPALTDRVRPVIPR